MSRRINVDRRKELVQYIISFRAEHCGIDPTIREIGEGLGIRSVSTVSGYLDRMENDGMLKRVRIGKRVAYVIKEETNHE